MSCSDIESNKLHGYEERNGTNSPGRFTFKRWKWFCAIVGIGAFMYITMIFSSPAPLKEHARSKETANEQLTIVLNTFKRHDMMLGETHSMPNASHIVFDNLTVFVLVLQTPYRTIHSAP